MEKSQSSKTSYFYIALTFVMCLTMIYPATFVTQTAKAQILGTDEGLPDGTFFRLLSDTNKIFKVESGTKRQLPFPAEEVMNCLGEDPKNIVNGTSAEEGLPVGAGLFCNPNNTQRSPDGSLISDLPDSDVTSIYLIENGTRRPFPSNEVFDCLGYSYSNIHIANSADVDLPIGEGMTCAGPSFDLSCGVSQSVTRGQDAYIPLHAYNLSGIDQDINVSLKSKAVEMSNTPLPLTVKNGYTDYGIITTNSLTIGQTYTLNFGADANNISRSCSSNLTVEGITPTVDLKFNGSDGPTTPNPSNGDRGQISWTTTNADTCKASGAGTWDGDITISNGSETYADITKLEVGSTYTLGLSCTSVDGITASDSVEVSVGDPQPPTADFYCEGDTPGQTTAGYCGASYGSSALLFFSTTYAETCTIDPSINSYDPGTSDKTGISTGPLTSSTIYTLSCDGPGGNVQKVAHVIVGSSSATVDIKCADNNSYSSDGPCYIPAKSNIILTWSSNDCSSISIDQGIGEIDYNNVKDGLEVQVNETTTFTISCTVVGGKGDVITDSVVVNTDPAQQRAVDLKCSTTLTKPTDSFCTIEKGSVVTLSWTSNRCGPLNIDPNIGDVSQIEEQSLDQAVNETTTFSIGCPPIIGDAMTLSDSVTVNVTDSVATSNCAPSPLNITKGGAPGVISVDVAVTNYKASQIDIYPSFEDFAPVQYPTFSYENNPLSKPGVASVILSTDQNSQTGIFTLKILATGENFVPAICFVTVIVSGETPNPPINVQANTDGECGTVNVTWQRPKDGQVPDSYQVYRWWRSLNTKVKATFIPVGPVVNDSGLSNGNFSFTDADPLFPDDQNIYGVKSISGGVSSEVVPSNTVIPTSCAASLSQSDKDLSKVGNYSGNPISCNNASDPLTLPGQGVFKTGTRVQFRINVCNSGSQPLTGLVVTEKGYSNLTDIKAEEYVKDVANQNNCINKDSGDGTFYLNDLQPKLNQSDPTPVCTLLVSATLTAPEKSSGYLYRFWNQAIITSNELDPKVVSTPPYLFSNGGNDVVPTRGESAR